ncbi:MAG: TrbC/VirB2 family protein [Acidobacteria bacterium]|nr:TrbC/VirB2 family protein [Acidobacteriota bacterium]
MPIVSGACRIASNLAPFRRGIPTLLLLLQESALLAQGTGTSPWVMAVDELSKTFTGPLAKGLSLIAIVVGGLMFAYGEGGSKKALAGVVFGLGMALGAANFMKWLFGV